MITLHSFQSENEEYWITSDGRKIPIKQLSNLHIQNILYYFPPDSQKIIPIKKEATRRIQENIFIRTTEYT